MLGIVKVNERAKHLLGFNQIRPTTACRKLLEISTGVSGQHYWGRAWDCFSRSILGAGGVVCGDR